MGEIVVFPEQFSFDVRVQRSNPRRKLTIKNLGIMACKVSITMPETDSFIVSDGKGKTVGGKIIVNMIPDSSCCFYVQKKASVGIVPEDRMLITGGKKPYTVALKPAVSLVSIEELESVADAQSDNSSLDIQSNDQPSTAKSILEDDQNISMASQDEEEPKHRVSKIKPPTKRISKNQFEATNAFNPGKRMKQPLETPEETNNFEFSPSDFQIPQLGEDEEEPPAVPPKAQKSNKTKIAAPKPQVNRAQNKNKAPISPAIEKQEANRSEQDTGIPMPIKLDQEPQLRKPSQIPVPHRHPDLPPEADVLEQSLHVKFSIKDDSFLRNPQKVPKVVKWYDDDAFKNIEEPNFSFELMMTGEKEDPVFCIDGDYYDSSGRLLTVQQGKGKTVFVTEDGYETRDENEIDDDENY